MGVFRHSGEGQNDVTAAVVYPRDCRYNALLL